MTPSPSSTDLTEVTTRLPAANVIFASGPTGFVFPPFPPPAPDGVVPAAPALRPAFPRVAVLSPVGAPVAGLAPVVEVTPAAEAAPAAFPSVDDAALAQAGRLTNDDFLGSDDEPATDAAQSGTSAADVLTNDAPTSENSYGANGFLADNTAGGPTARGNGFLADNAPGEATAHGDGFRADNATSETPAHGDGFLVDNGSATARADGLLAETPAVAPTASADGFLGADHPDTSAARADGHAVGEVVERGVGDRYAGPEGEHVVADNAAGASAASTTSAISATSAEETSALRNESAQPAEPVPSPGEDTPDAAPLNSPTPVSPDLTSSDPPTGEALGQEIAAELSARAPTPQPAPQRPDNGEWRGIVLVTGTDTDVGKTIVTAAVAAAAQSSGLRVAVIKPGQTGTITGAPTDIDVVTRLAAPDTTRVLAEYPEPMAPLAAATVAELPPLELYEVVDAIRSEAEKHDLVLVEGAGGLLVPMGVRPSGEAWTVADLAITLNAQTIVVARAGLGTLNHTALTLEALNRRGVPAGVVIGAWPANPELVHWANLSELVPHLVGALPEGAGSMDPGVFRRSAPGWLTPPLYGVIDNWRVWAEETDGH